MKIATKVVTLSLMLCIGSALGAPSNQFVDRGVGCFNVQVQNFTEVYKDIPELMKRLTICEQENNWSEWFVIVALHVVIETHKIANETEDMNLIGRLGYRKWFVTQMDLAQEYYADLKELDKVTQKLLLVRPKTKQAAEEALRKFLDYTRTFGMKWFSKIQAELDKRNAKNPEKARNQIYADYFKKKYEMYAAKAA